MNVEPITDDTVHITFAKPFKDTMYKFFCSVKRTDQYYMNTNFCLKNATVNGLDVKFSDKAYYLNRYLDWVAYQ